MIRTILVPTAGTDSDEAVFRTALAVARPLGAHLRFWHARVRPSEAVSYTPYADFAVGVGAQTMIDQLAERAIHRSVEAARRCTEFCRREDIPLIDRASPEPRVSASFEEESHDVLHRLMLRARHSDMVVLARPKYQNGLPDDILERLLLGCGRPLLLAPAAAAPRVTGTVLICWKETEEAARALAAAYPLLRVAERVLLAGAREANGLEESDLAVVAAELAWHGIAAEPILLGRHGKQPAERILALAKDEAADLLVMGAYGRSRAIELFFGGFTRTILQRAELPAFLVH
jgi:nucleotide-binding universal stress UspA family protein